MINFLQGTSKDLEKAMEPESLILKTTVTPDPVRDVLVCEVEWRRKTIMERYEEIMEAEEAYQAESKISRYPNTKKGAILLLETESEIDVARATATPVPDVDGVWKVTTPSDPFVEYALVYIDEEGFEEYYRQAGE